MSGHPGLILKGLAHPAFATRIGGSTTVIDGYVPNSEASNQQ
jgi:hypothetical protein